MAMHKTEPNSLHDPNEPGGAIPGHRAGCAAIGVSGTTEQPTYYLEDSAWCDCTPKGQAQTKTTPEIAATVMLGILAEGCNTIRQAARLNLLEGADKFWISRGDLIALEAFARAGDSNCAVILARIMTSLRDAAVTVTRPSENVSWFRCGACGAEGNPQTFKHLDWCACVQWDRWTSGWET